MAKSQDQKTVGKAKRKIEGTKMLCDPDLLFSSPTHVRRWWGNLSGEKHLELTVSVIREAVRDALNEDNGRENLFRLIHENTLDTKFISLLREKWSIFPPKTEDLFKKWVADYKEPQPKETVESDAPDNILSGVKNVPVENPLAAFQKKPALAPLDVAGQLKKDDEQRESKPHLEWSVAAICEAFQISPGDITRYYSTHKKAGGENDTSYQVLEFEVTDESGTFVLCQVMTNNWKGMQTFIFKPAQRIDVNDLMPIDPDVAIDAGTGWTVRCVSQNQYGEGIVDILKTPVGKRGHQVRRTYWSGRCDAVIDTVAAYIQAHGKRLDPNNNSRIECGALPDTSAHRMNNALKEGRINGLEGIGSLDELTDFLIEGDPDLQEILDDITLCGFNGQELNEIFTETTQYKLLNSDKALVAGSHAGDIRTFEDFLVATGLANKTGNLLVPNMDRVNTLECEL